MSETSPIEHRNSPLPEHATLELRLLEIAARYLFVNSLPLPVLVVVLAGFLSYWAPLRPLAEWVLATVLAWSALGLSLYRFLHDDERARRLRQWKIGLACILAAATTVLASVSLLFWQNDNRENNVLLYAFLAAAMANAGGQSAPSRTLAFANLTPYGVVFVTLSLIHERYPLNVGFVSLEALYFGLIAMYARAVRQLASEMLRLREEKRALVERLSEALADATAARKRAEQASRAKSQFLANMSHELRTPLNAVLGFAELIRDRMFGDGALARYSEYAAHIHASGSHLLGLINGVLDLSKIEAGKLELTLETFDLVAEAREGLRFVEPQAAQGCVELRREMPETLEIVADRRSIRQIAVNLLGNAVKFTPSGGTVTLSLERQPGGKIALAVSDTGIGIRAEDLEKVLESFGQGRHDVIPTGEIGTGLGLAIAKNLAEAHGGTIAIESSLGEGTTVTVTLPQNAGARFKAA